MINSWAAAAQAMINKNADYRAGAGLCAEAIDRISIRNRLDPVPPGKHWRTAAGQGGKGLPLGNPGPGCMPTVGKTPRSGLPSTGREPHAIPGVTLPFAVILTAHRLQSPHPAARQTAQGFVGDSKTRARQTAWDLVVGWAELGEAQH